LLVDPARLDLQPLRQSADGEYLHSGQDYIASAPEFVSLIRTLGSRIRGEHQPSDFKLQDAAMSINLDTNDIVTMFQVRATAELKRELDEVKWWEDRVRRGLVRREHVEAYIQASKRIIRTKRHVLGFPEFPC
jgi:hypothetical protein